MITKWFKARFQWQTVALIATLPILHGRRPFLPDPLQPEVQDFQDRFIVWNGGFGAPGDAVRDWERATGLEPLAQAEIE